MKARPIGVKGGEKNDPENPDAWEAEISKLGRGGALCSPTVAFGTAGSSGSGGVECNLIIVPSHPQLYSVLIYCRSLYRGLGGRT